jgi:hypothetical protein
MHSTLLYSGWCHITKEKGDVQSNEDVLLSCFDGPQRYGEVVTGREREREREKGESNQGWIFGAKARGLTVEWMNIVFRPYECRWVG